MLEGLEDKVTMNLTTTGEECKWHTLRKCFWQEERKKAVCIGVNLQVYIDSNTYNSNLNIMEF